MKDHGTLVEPHTDKLAGNGQQSAQSGRRLPFIEPFPHWPEIIHVLEGIALIEKKGRRHHSSGNLSQVFHQRIERDAVRRACLPQVDFIGIQADRQVENKIIKDVAVGYIRAPHPVKQIFHGNAQDAEHFAQRFGRPQRAHIMHTHGTIQSPARIRTHQAARLRVFFHNRDMDNPEATAECLQKDRPRPNRSRQYFYPQSSVSWMGSLL